MPVTMRDDDELRFGRGIAVSRIGTDAKVAGTNVEDVDHAVVGSRGEPVEDRPAIGAGDQVLAPIILCPHTHLVVAGRRHANRTTPHAFAPSAGSPAGRADDHIIGPGGEHILDRDAGTAASGRRCRRGGNRDGVMVVVDPACDLVFLVDVDGGNATNGGRPGDDHRVAGEMAVRDMMHRDQRGGIGGDQRVGGERYRYHSLQRRHVVLELVAHHVETLRRAGADPARAIERPVPMQRPAHALHGEAGITVDPACPLFRSAVAEAHERAIEPRPARRIARQVPDEAGRYFERGPTHSTIPFQESGTDHAEHRLGQHLLIGVVGLHHLVPETLDRRSGLPLLA